MLIQEKLKRFYSEKPSERGGYIVGDEIIECENVHPNPVEGFSLSIENLEKLEDESVTATWHTHPNGSKNLSREDFLSFQNWADKKHYIVGKDGVMCYYVDEETSALLISEIDGCS